MLASRHVLEQPDGPVEIGAIRLSAGQGKVAELPADEFVIVSSGAVTLTQPDELMHLLEGAVTLEDERGARQTFSKGDIFLVEQNAQCSWESREHVKKVYVIYRPA